MSSPPPPFAHDAVLAQVVQAITDSVRASYTAPEGLLVDPSSVRAVADAAAAMAETAARDAIATLLRPHLQAPASGELVDMASTLVDPTAAPATAAPTTAVPPTPIALSAVDLAAVAAQLGTLSTSPRQVLPPSSSAPPAPPLVLDAETLATLHQQAIAVLNIKALIPVTLDLATANYTR